MNIINFELNFLLKISLKFFGTKSYIKLCTFQDYKSFEPPILHKYLTNLYIMTVNPYSQPLLYLVQKLIIKYKLNIFKFLFNLLQVLEESHDKILRQTDFIPKEV